MKQTLLALIMLVALPFMSKAQNLLTLENNTKHDVYAAYATYDGKCWVCVGWYKVEKFDTKSFNLGNYNGQIFIHGENRTIGMERNWGDYDNLCVEEGEAFNIRCPRKVDCKVKKMFSLINSSMDGNTVFIFNP